MPNLNTVQLMGNLTRDVELRYTPKGTAVAEISLAINRHWTTGDGEKKEDTTFVDVTLWGRQAEIVQEYCGKGMPLFISGRLTLDKWDDKETGKSRSKLKVVGESIQLLGSREKSSGESRTPRTPARPSEPTRSTRQKDPDPMDAADDDIPF